MLPSYIGATFSILFLNFVNVQCGSLVYVIDITGSMRNIVPQVFKHIREVQTSGAENTVLVTFNSQNVRVRAKTKDETVLNEALSSIRTYGGAKCAENSLSGIIEGLKNSLPNSFMYVFTDATAKDYYKVDTVIDLCEKKHPQINFVLTGNCGDSSNEQIKVYYDIAEKCNGRVILINETDVSKMLALLTPYSHVTSVPFNIDNKTDYAIVSAFRDVVDIVVTRDDFGKTSTETIRWIQNVKMLKVFSTVPGNYVAWVKGAGQASVKLFLKTDFSFKHGFSDVVTKSLADASKQPIAGKNQHLLISVADPSHLFRVERANILSLKHKLLLTLSLKSVGDDFYITDKFVPPNSLFIIQVRATNKETGTLIFSNSKTVIEPTEPLAVIPIVSISEGPHIAVEYDSSVELRCRISAYPEPTIVWFAKGRILKSSTELVDPPYDFISSLRLENITKSQNYVCMAKNEVGTKSTGIQIHVKSPFKVIKHLPAVTKAHYGQDVTLICTIAFNPNIKTSYQWYFKDLNGTAQPVTNNKLLHYNHTTLTIESLDINKEGEYSYTIWVTEDQIVNKKCTTNVRIHDFAPPSINATQYFSNQTLRASCVAKGNPKPIVTWYYGKHKEGDLSKINITGEELQLDFKLNNTGYYVCKAENAVGSSDANFNLLVDEIPHRAHVGDSDLEIGCEYNDWDSEATLVWKDNDNKIITSDTKYDVTNIPNALYLSIKNPALNDTGYFICEINAYDGISFLVTETFVSVAPKSPIVSISEGSQMAVKYNSSIVLMCKVSAYPEPTIIWQADGKILGSNIKIVSPPYDFISYLRLHDVTKSQNYVCQANNKLGNKFSSIEINVMSPFEVIKDLPAATKAHYGQNVTLTCDIAFNPNIKTSNQWYFKDLNGTAQPVTNNKLLHYNQTALTIKSLDIDKEGEYSYTIWVTEDQIVNKTCTTNVRIDNLASPSINATQYFSNQTLRASCLAKGNPKPIVTWYYGKHKEGDLSKINITGEELQLDFKLNNTGYYVCKAENAVGLSDAEFNLLVDEIPRRAHVGDSDLKIGCEYNGWDPKATLVWKDSYNKVITSDFKYDVTNIPNVIYLSIKNPALNDTGYFICEFNDNNGNSFLITKIFVSAVPKSPIVSISEGSQMEVEYNSSIVLTCKVSAYPKPTIMWQADGKTLTSNIKLINPPYDFISHLRLHDVTKSQNYVCQAKSTLGNEFSNIKINVMSPFEVIKDLPAVTKAHYGQDVTLTCDIAFNPNIKTSYQWYFKDLNGTAQPVTNNKLLHYNQTALTIKSLDIDKEGEYSYTIWVTEDHTVNKTCTTNVRIDNLEKPAISLNYEKISVPEGKGTKISCKITKGVPRPTIKWRFEADDKNSFESEIFKDLILLNGSNEDLIIRVISLNNSGKYICTATNILGSVRRQTELVVTKAPEVSIQGTSKALVEFDGTHEFICKVIAHPQPRIFWKDRFGNVINTPEATANGYELISRLKLSNIRNSSQYTCYAENDVGFQIKAVSVSSKPPFIVNSVLKEKTKVKYEEPVKLLCDITSDLPIERIWFSDKTKELSLKGITLQGNKDEVFVINSMDVDLEGRYGCKVWLVSDPTVFVEQETILEIEDLSLPSINATQYVLNQTVTALCLTKGTPKPTVTWYYLKDKEVIDFNITGEQLQFDLIRNVTGFYYQCIAENSVGVTNVDFILQFDDTLSKSLVGDSVLTIECEINGEDPEETYVWKNSDNKVVTSDSKYSVKQISNDLYLSIKKPSLNDTGYFICDVSNNEKRQIIVKETYVTDAFQNDKSFYGDTYSIFILENEPTDIKCNMSHLDSKSVRWYKNGLLTNVVGTLYHIKNASSSDEGDYTCRVNQENGSLSETYIVKVGSKPTFDKEYESLTVFWSGDDDDFVNCSLKSSKPLDDHTKVEWSYNGKKTNVEGYEHPILGWGLYTCKVSNDFGEINRYYNVTTDGCLIPRKVNFNNNPPLLLSFDIGVESKLTIVNLDTVNNYTYLETEQKIRLSCHNPHSANHFNISPDEEFLVLECLGEDKFVVNDNTYKYTDIKCEKPVEVTIDTTKRPCTHNDSELIQVGFNVDSGGFLETYTVCYDHGLNVPTYAITELSGSNLGSQVDYNKWINIPNYRGVNNTDCDNESKCCYGKEQLVNAADVTFGPPQVATFYDYNAVGIWKPCENESRMSWQMIEDNVRKLLNSIDNIQVRSGASGYERQSIGMVPRYLWKLIGSHGVIVYVNDPKPTETDIKCSASIEILNYMIKDKDQFTYLCSIDEFSNEFNVVTLNSYTL